MMIGYNILPHMTGHKSATSASILITVGAVFTSIYQKPVLCNHPLKKPRNLRTSCPATKPYPPESSDKDSRLVLWRTAVHRPRLRVMVDGSQAMKESITASIVVFYNSLRRNTKHYLIMYPPSKRSQMLSTNARLEKKNR